MALARYMAVSASRMRASGLSLSPAATPMLAEVAIWRRLALASRNGSRRTASSRSATTVSRSPVKGPSESTTNSSPPRRPTVSDSRTAEESLSATARSSSSPTLWPKVSFTFLKSSRSMKNTAMGVPLLRAVSRNWYTFWSTKSRFGRPVRGSCRAW